MSGRQRSTYFSVNRMEIWSGHSEIRAPMVGEIDIWNFGLERKARTVSTLYEILSDDERARAYRYVFPKDRDHFIVCRGKLRTILGKYLGLAPKEIRFSYNRFGKPFLASEQPGLRFNLSHSRGLAAIAISFDREVGIDLEFIDHGFDFFGVAASAFSENDVTRLRSQSLDKQASLFFAGWTRKEALLKAVGDGLSTSNGMEDSISYLGDAAHSIISPGSGEVSKWFVRSIEVPFNFQAAVAVEGEFGKFKRYEI